MMRQITVHLGERPEPIGTLFCDTSSGRFQSSFEYSRSWLADRRRFAIDPALPLVQGRVYHQPERGVSPFSGAISDTGPDGWALIVIARNFRLEGGHFDASRLTPVDFLLQVSDQYRIGALRFRDEKGVFRGADVGRTVPPFIKLDDLLNATEAMERDKETNDQIRFLMEEATSIGGLRPKASIVSPHGALEIAKFPSVHDVRDITRGEALALRLAELAGINTCGYRLQLVLDRAVIVVKRFDRTEAGGRIPYMSAMTMLETSHQQGGTYVDIAEMLRRHGADVRTDMHELFKRMVLNVLISNTDDHLGNHAFLYGDLNRWRLSPAFDINPFSDTVRTHKTSVSNKTGPKMSIEACLSECRRFDLDLSEAKSIVGNIAGIVRQWRDIATSPDIGMTDRQADLFGGAFEHDDLKTAATFSAQRQKGPGE